MQSEFVEHPEPAPHAAWPQAPAKLCAAFSSTMPQAELVALLQRMVQAYNLQPGQLQIVDDLPMGAMAGPPSGLATGVDLAGQPAFCAVAAGEIRSAQQVAQRVDPALAARQPASQSALAGALLRQHGAAALHRLNDVFALVVADLDAPHARLANDRFGSGPLFYLLHDDLLLAASEVKAIAAVMALRHDPAAYGQFFYIGHLLRSQTLLHDVKLLGPGQMIEWRPAGGVVRSYWDVTQLPTAGSEGAPLEEINDVLQRAVSRATLPGVQDTLLLSGGLDSRLMLGVLLSQGHKPKALTLEHAGFARSIDGFLAQQVASLAGIDLDYRTTRPNFYRSGAALDVFHVSDGMTPSFGLFISQVYPELAPSMGRVWEGVALGQSLGGHTQVGASLRSNLPHFLASRPPNRRFLQRFLQRDWFEQVEAGYARALEEEVSRFPDSEDGWIKFQMVNRNRRRVGMPPHHQYSRKVIALTPGLDSELIEFTFGLSLQQRQHCQLYGQLLLRFYPQLAQAPTISGEHVLTIEEVAAGAMGTTGHSTAPLRNWAKRLGLAPYLRAVQARLGRVERSKTDAVPASAVIQTLRTTGFDRSIYQRAQIEHALTKAERGSIYWLNALMPIFYIELWHTIFDPAALATLRQDVFVG